MTADDQIRASVANGLTRPAIEALLGRELTGGEVQVYRKAKAVYDLQLRKRRSERKYQHLSGTETKRKHDDKVASIDEQLDAALARIVWTRRHAAETDVETFINTYLVGLLMEDPPSPKFREMLRNMQTTILQNGQPLQLLVGRGAGKTTAALALACWLLFTAQKKFVVIVSQNHSSAQSLLRELGRVILEPDTPLAQDYPEVVLPF